MDDDEHRTLFMLHFARQHDAHIADEPRACELAQVDDLRGGDGLLDLVDERSAADDPPAVDGRAVLLTQALVAIVTGSSNIQFRAHCVGILGASCESNLRSKLQECLNPLFAAAPTWASSKTTAVLPTNTATEDALL